MSWQQLIAIGREARQMRDEDSRKPLVECPNCGQPLQRNKHGVLNCPSGDFRGQG